MSDRVPPYSDEYERSVLGALLLDSARIHCFELTAEEFYTPLNALCYRAICSLIFDRGGPVDCVTVADEAARINHGRAVAGLEGLLADVAARVPTAENVGWYAERVRNLAKHRAVIAALAEQSTVVWAADSDDIEETAEELQRKIVQTCGARARIVSVGDAAREAMAGLLDESARATTIPTGLACLDDVIAGLPVGYLSLIGGRPSQGKSVLARVIADNVAMRGVSVGYIALEEKQRDVARALLIRHARVETTKVIHRHFTGFERERLMEEHRRFNTRPLYICDERPLTPRQACQRLRQMHAQHKIELAFVDYWNRLSLPGKRTLREEATECVDLFSAVAHELGIALVVVAQLNRENEREGRRPQLSDLKESGGWEEAGWVVLLVHRESFAKSDADPHEIEIKVAKSKLSPTGTQKAFWEGQFLSISDYPVSAPEPYRSAAEDRYAD